MLSDEASYFISVHEHPHWVCIWGGVKHHAFVEYQRECPKVNMWFAW